MYRDNVIVLNKGFKTENNDNIASYGKSEKHQKRKYNIMFDLRKFYKKENEEIRDSYESSIITIKEILAKTGNYENSNSKKDYMKLLNSIAKSIVKMYDYEKKLDDDYFTSKSFDELLQENNEMYEELLPENYKSSYTNPEYCVKIFGEKFGQIICFFYTEYRECITYAYTHKIFKMEEHNKLFIETYNYIINNEIKYDHLKKIISSIRRKDRTKDTFYSYKERYDINYKYYTNIIEKSDLSDLRYMFKSGKHITEVEIKMAKFLLGYPDEKIKILAKEIVNAYLRGFIVDGKDISKKSTVGLVYVIGLEKIYREIINQFRNKKLECFVCVIESKKMDKQYVYDHRFDIALNLDDEYKSMMEKSYNNALEMNKEILSKYSGIMVIETFGEKPFNPENKKECLKLNTEQQKLYKMLNTNIYETIQKYMPEVETSFSIVAFPTPEIGDNFKQIFEDILEINMLDNDKYERIQQKIIDALDKADYVHIKGKDGNLTDIKVKMQEIKNPDKETNFVNCCADVNIPLGEVFTSPQLTGTNGILHLKKTFLEELKYIDLKLSFKNGFIEDYSCRNYNNDEENKKYVHENLIFPNKTLPMGEFAIGTNTLAYAVSQKYNIIDILPILIIEKMGPHFAIGDTCFTYAEDFKVYNRLDNKEITARDNEKTILRKKDVNEAYTNKHTDITLPYEVIEFISVITKSNEKIDIIRDGKFVLEGTEELNEPLD